MPTLAWSFSKGDSIEPQEPPLSLPLIHATTNGAHNSEDVQISSLADPISSMGCWLASLGPPDYMGIGEDNPYPHTHWYYTGLS